LFGNNETPASQNIKGDKFVGKYYVEFENQLKREAQNLKDNEQTPIMIKAQELLQKWEEGDEETLELWRKMNNWVYEGFNKTYNKLGVDFDVVQYESNTYLLGKEIIKIGLEKGVFYKKDDGSIWCDLSDVGLDEKIVQRADGTSVYITQDLGTATERFKDFDLDRIIYTVGNEQDYHFKVLFAILKKLGFSWSDQLEHLSYGMVDLPDGKMKSREGTVIDADDIMQEMYLEAEKKSLELGKLEGFTQEEKNNLYEKIGIDGSGKSTQAKFLEEFLSSKNETYLTCEPTFNPIGQMIRDIFSGKINSNNHVITGLFVADRLDHILNEYYGIISKLEKGINVISDRYYFSSFAYQGAHVPFDWV
ncbi:unnamed protein product, partial [Darwinula stevensoni]